MVISQTPLRISFVGGGTDLRSFYEVEDGMVVSSTIDKYVYVIVKERFDDKIYINYSSKEIVDDVTQVQHDLVRETMIMTGITTGIEITTLADIPSEGSGLGSSSSITVGLLNALHNFAGVQVTSEQLAREACEIEINVCNKPIGKQDQYIAAYGGLNKIIFHPDDTVSISPIYITNENFLRFSSSLLLFYTNKTRDANIILSRQKRKTDNKRESLRAMRDLVPKFSDYLIDSRLSYAGRVLHENWLLKKGLVNSISNPRIDKMYELAREAGAVGGKICGAGGGGFLLLFVTRNKQEKVRESLDGYRELPFMLEKFGSRIIFNFRRYPLK